MLCAGSAKKSNDYGTTHNALGDRSIASKDKILCNWIVMSVVTCLALAMTCSRQLASSPGIILSGGRSRYGRYSKIRTALSASEHYDGPEKAGTYLKYISKWQRWMVEKDDGIGADESLILKLAISFSCRARTKGFGSGHLGL